MINLHLYQRRNSNSFPNEKLRFLHIQNNPIPPIHSGAILSQKVTRDGGFYLSKICDKMENKPLLEWTKEEVDNEINRTKSVLYNTEDLILSRIKEIEELRLTFPKNNRYLNILRHSLSCEIRRLKLRLSRIKGHSHTLKEAILFIKSRGCKCEICGSTSSPSIDHIIPISKGGHDGVSNLRVLCTSCNSKKGNK